MSEDETRPEGTAEPHTARAPAVTPEVLKTLRAQASKLKGRNYDTLVWLLEEDALTPELEAQALRHAIKTGSFTEAAKIARGGVGEPDPKGGLQAWFDRRQRTAKSGGHSYTHDIIDEQIAASGRTHEGTGLKGLVGFVSWWVVLYLIIHYLGPLWGAGFMGATVGFFVGALYGWHRQDKLLGKLGLRLVECSWCRGISLGPRELYRSGLCHSCANNPAHYPSSGCGFVGWLLPVEVLTECGVACGQEVKSSPNPGLAPHNAFLSVLLQCDEKNCDWPVIVYLPIDVSTRPQDRDRIAKRSNARCKEGHSPLLPPKIPPKILSAETENEI